jgi:esterase/lipase
MFHSAMEEIRKIETPMLLMHGTEDKIVSVTDTQILNSVAGVDAGVLGHATTKEMWLCEGAEHCQLWDKEKEEFEKRVLKFLKRFATV